MHSAATSGNLLALLHKHGLSQSVLVVPLQLQTLTVLLAQPAAWLDVSSSSITICAEEEMVNKKTRVDHVLLEFQRQGDNCITDVKLRPLFLEFQAPVQGGGKCYTVYVFTIYDVL